MEQFDMTKVDLQNSAAYRYEKTNLHLRYLFSKAVVYVWVSSIDSSWIALDQ